MTDRGSSALHQAADSLGIGPSRLEWDGTTLTIDIDERATPHLDRLRGQVRLRPHAVTDFEARLHANGAHVWRPFAPGADIEVSFDRPGWQWQGSGYFDANFGTRALEADFSTWTWSRMPVRDGTVCFYDAHRRDGSDLSLALKFDRDGAVHAVPAPPVARLSRSRWALRRETRADRGTRATTVKPMLDAPFYCRSAIRTVLNGETSVGIHEALDLDRFASPLLKPMLAFRVPRRPG